MSWHHVWEEIGTTAAALVSTIPSAYGVCPQNIVEDKSACTADSWSLGFVSWSGPLKEQIY